MWADLEKRLYLSIVMFLLMVTGCSQQPLDTRQDLNIATSTGQPLTSTITQVSASETLIPTKTSTDLPTSTEVPNDAHCVEIEDAKALDDISIDGLLIFEGDPEDEYEMYSLASINGELNPFLESIDIAYLGSTSPNHEWFVFYSEKRDKDRQYLGTDLVVANAAQEMIVQPEEPTWGSFGKWLDNERLIIYPINDVPFGTILLYNPFTEQQEELLPSFSDIYTLKIHGEWNSARVVYHPSLDWVAYLQEESPAIDLLDLKNDQRVWHMNRKKLPLLEPIWMPDGEHLLVFMPTEATDKVWDILSVDLDGNMEHLYTFYKPPMLYIHPRLSPNGKYLTFWSQGETKDTRDLIVYDIEAGQVIDFCISMHQHERVDDALWSPEGDRFLIRLYNPSASNHEDSVEQTLLIDVNQKRIVELKIKRVPSVWLRIVP